MPVSRFAALAGIPERTYRYRLAKLRAGMPRGPWPTPAVDAVEELAAKYAQDWPAWGHRKIAAMMRADGHAVSTSTIERALRRRNLLLPRGCRADRKSWAMLRRKVFHEPPSNRNRVWQMDFSEFETPSGGIWRICAVIDYVAKYCLAATVTPTCQARDAVACLNAAVAEATRLLGLDDLRADHGTLDLLDETTGELIAVVPAPIAVVTDNGSAFKSRAFAALFAGEDPLLRHVRTRVRSPQTNGVIERRDRARQHRLPTRTRRPHPSRTGDPARISRTVCVTPVMPGVNVGSLTTLTHLITHGQPYLGLLTGAAGAGTPAAFSGGAPVLTREPPLACYTTADCPTTPRSHQAAQR